MKKDKVIAFTLTALLFLGINACSKSMNNIAALKKEGTAAIPVLTELEAERLQAEAANRFMRITSGYFGPRLKKTNDASFYYLPEELDSMEKLMAYLNEVLTTETAKGIIDPNYFKVMNNKLAFKPQDYISEREWSKAKYKITYDKEDKKVYVYTVPSPGGETETIKIEFRYERQGWRIATPPYEFL